MIGCCGVPTNYPPRNFLRRFFFSLFHQGIFRDIRREVYDGYLGQNGDLVPSLMLTGGSSLEVRGI